MRFAFIQKFREYAHSTPVMEDVAARLRRRRVRVECIVPEQHLLELGHVTPRHDLYVLRPGVELGLSLAGILHSQGARIINSYPACALVQDKAQVAHHLLRAGLPHPKSFITGSVRKAMRFLEQQPVVVKPHRGSYGEGVCVHHDGDELPACNARGGYFAQERKFSTTGLDLKVYVIGEQVSVIRRPFPARSFAEKLGQPCEVDSNIRAIALRVGELFGLDIYGIDILETDQGPCVVDVNYFPGFVGVTGAAAAIADHLLTLAADAGNRVIPYSDSAIIPANISG